MVNILLSLRVSMKRTFTLLFWLLPLFAFAQPPGYYLPASGLNREPLRVALCNIIRHHTTLSYTPGLWTAYHTTDVKTSGKLWDVYSDIPGGTPAYEYTVGTDQCSGSSPSGEHGCYNREHTWPQSKFTSDTPMQTDLFIVYPTDYFVNSKRGDFPYGKVGTATRTFTNGSTIGDNVYPGAPVGSCFEPIDSFKGDLARNYFYVSTCYRNDSAKFVSWEIATQVNLNPWAIQMLLEWHHNDPVSQKEIDRNNAVYALQGNRNPFIDNPYFADCIWGNGDCSKVSVNNINSENDGLVIYPNPAKSELNIMWTQNSSRPTLTVGVYDMQGREVFSTKVESVSKSGISISLNGYTSGVYTVRIIDNLNTVTKRVIIE